MGCGQRDPIAGMKERGAREALQSPGAFDPVALLSGGVTGLMRRAAVDASELVMTATAAKHLSRRPYMNSTLLMREIMQSGKAIRDPGRMSGAWRWDVPGAFNGSKGAWELVVNPRTMQVVHFLFRSTR